MRNILANSVNHALADGLYHLHHFSFAEESRNGPVLVSRTPVMTIFQAPQRRVLVNKNRDANPFFHLFEALWMLAGRNDLAFPKTFISTFGQFSDDGMSLWGAYGHRWRRWFGYDQLTVIIEELKSNPKTRRAVLEMWDAGFKASPGDDPLNYRVGDLEQAAQGGKDVPCNTHIYFDTIGDKLNMTTCARGLDILLGAYGANAVHMSVLHEYVAAAMGWPLGVFRQFANNYHLYTELYPRLKLTRDSLPALADSIRLSDPYGQPGPMRDLDYSKPRITPQPLIMPGQFDDWHEDLIAFLSIVDEGIPTDGGFDTPFFIGTVAPMYNAWFAWKEGEYEQARNLALRIEASDWRIAAQDWLLIREERRAEKQNG